MLYGQPPFHEPEISPMALYNKISKGPSTIQWPPFFNPRATDLILKLMETDPSKRYGNMRNGAGDVFAHPWFKEVVWQNLLTKNISPPYIPKTISDGDASAYVSTWFPASRVPLALTQFIAPVLNDTQRTNHHPSTDGPGWTSSAIFSKNGIIRREVSHVWIFATFVLSMFLVVPVTLPPAIVGIKSSYFNSDLVFCRQANPSKCTP